MKQICTRLSMLATLALSVSAGSAYAQQDVRRAGSTESAAQQGTRTVTGKVLDEAGQPVAGAAIAVSEVGTGRVLTGTYTNASGQFAVQVPQGSTVRIRVSYIGYAENITTVAANQSSADFTLAESSSTLEEVQITGFGTIVKRDNAGASQAVSGEKLVNLPQASVTATLQGRLAGVQIVQSNGIPGSQTRIRGRGQSTIGSGGQPLVVVDGIPVFNQDPSDRSFGENPTTATNYDPLSSIPAGDIESVTFLQDGYSTAIYGSRAANGVLLITTKQGMVGKTTFSANYSIGTVDPTRKLPLLDGREWLALRSELYSAQNGGAQMPANFDVHPNGNIVIPASQAAQTNTNWYDYVFRTGTVQDFGLTARGGSEKLRFYSGVNYHQNEGFSAGAIYRRFGIRFNIENQATNRVKIGLNFSINREANNQVRESYNGGIGSVLRGDALAIMPVFNADGTYFGSQFSNPNTVNSNPLAVEKNSSYVTTNLRVIGNLYTEVQLFPENKLNWRTEYGIDANGGSNVSTTGGVIRYVQQQAVQSGAVVSSGPFFQSGNFSERRYDWFNWNFKTYLTWKPNLGEQHQLSVVGGTEAFATRNSFTTIYTNGNAGFIDSYFTNFSGGLSTNITGVPVFLPSQGGYNGDLDRRTNFLSFYLRGDYRWKERYIFGASLRADASTRFGPSNRWGVFPGLAAGWIVSKEPGIKLPSAISFLKIRGSFGSNGNAEFANFLYLSTYTFSGTYGGQNGLQPGPFENPDLKWEQTFKYNLGIDFELFESRISGTVDLWYQRSSDLILVQRIPGSAGSDGSTITRNRDDVVIRNKGIDVTLSGTVIVAPRDRFGWRASASLGFLDNILLTSGGTPPDGFQQGPGDARIVDGQPVGVAYLVRHAFVDPATGDEYFYDLQGNAIRGPINNTLLQNRQPAGNPFPWLQGGFENVFSWKGIEVSALFTFQVGNTIYDDGAKFQIGEIAGSNQRREILNRWTTPGQITDVPRLGFVGDFNANNSTRFLYDADFIRLRQLTVGYNFAPELVSRIGLTSAKVYFTGINLFVFTKFPGSDPEVVRYANDGNFGNRTQEANVSFGAPYLGTPQARTISFGVTLGF
jgi:TonB-dependent starch-binding outer membrane protein SusC